MSCVESAFFSRRCFPLTVCCWQCVKKTAACLVQGSQASVHHAQEFMNRKHWISLTSNTGVCVRQGGQLLPTHLLHSALLLSFLSFLIFFFSPSFEVGSHFVAQADSNSWVQAILSFAGAGVEAPSIVHS